MASRSRQGRELAFEREDHVAELGLLATVAGEAHGACTTNGMLSPTSMRSRMAYWPSEREHDEVERGVSLLEAGVGELEVDVAVEEPPLQREVIDRELGERRPRSEGDARTKQLPSSKRDLGILPLRSGHYTRGRAPVCSSLLGRLDKGVDEGWTRRVVRDPSPREQPCGWCWWLPLPARAAHGSRRRDAPARRGGAVVRDDAPRTARARLRRVGHSLCMVLAESHLALHTYPRPRAR